MKINWKARFKNKTFVISFAALIISFIYTALSMFDIVPSISEDSVVKFFTMAVNILGMLGIVVDPTTDGIKDSDRAMTYYTDFDGRMDDENDN
jgi:phi LC3 family holin